MVVVLDHDPGVLSGVCSSRLEVNWPLPKALLPFLFHEQ